MMCAIDTDVSNVWKRAINPFKIANETTRSGLLELNLTNLSPQCDRKSLQNALSPAKFTDVRFLSRREAILMFEQSDDARLAMKILQDKSVMGHKVNVSFRERTERKNPVTEQPPAFAIAKQIGPVVRRHYHCRQRKKVSEPDVSYNVKPASGLNEQEFTRRINSYLETHGPQHLEDKLINELLNRSLSKSLIDGQPQAAAHIQAEFGLWRLGAFRTKKSQFLLIGPYLCLRGNEAIATQKVCMNKMDSIYKEVWEPICPQMIKTLPQLARYMERFLAKFGPTSKIDPVFHFLMMSLYGVWSKLPFEQLMSHIQKYSTDIICVYDTIYLFSIAQHRTKCADALRQGQP